MAQFLYEDEDSYFDFPDGFNMLSEEDWMNFVVKRNEEIEEAENAIYDEIDRCDWTDIPGYPNYQANSNGEIRSIANGYPIILKSWPNKFGHRYVGVVDENGREYHKTVHRLVAITFIPNPNNYPVIRHLNDIPYDNRVCNLAWGTCKDNTRDMLEHGREYTRPIYCYEKDTVYRSGRAAAKDLGVMPSLIVLACQGKVHAVKGKYHLCYLEDKKDKLANKKEWFKGTNNYKPVKAINTKTGAMLFFNSRKEAAEYLGIPECGISSVISGYISHTHGWRFENITEE